MMHPLFLCGGNYANSSNCSQASTLPIPRAIGPNRRQFPAVLTYFVSFG
jgi:hypothetical protein